MHRHMIHRLTSGLSSRTTAWLLKPRIDSSSTPRLLLGLRLMNPISITPLFLRLRLGELRLRVIWRMPLQVLHWVESRLILCAGISLLSVHHPRLFDNRLLLLFSEQVLFCFSFTEFIDGDWEIVKAGEDLRTWTVRRHVEEINTILCYCYFRLWDTQ